MIEINSNIRYKCKRKGNLPIDQEGAIDLEIAECLLTVVEKAEVPLLGI